jgi:osmoprotectant transport system ATP-binding protein
MRDGALVQYDTPEGLLAHPADAFVESFVGTDRALKRLALVAAADALEPLAPLGHAKAVGAATTLRDALALMFAAGVDAVAVLDGAGQPIGMLTVSAIRRHALAAIDSAQAAP